jgi:hypothetical protein
MPAPHHVAIGVGVRWRGWDVLRRLLLLCEHR